jgi:hypothetical protein
MQWQLEKIIDVANGFQAHVKCIKRQYMHLIG